MSSWTDQDGGVPGAALADPGTLRGRAVTRLRDDILTGTLAPGLVIRDAELAAKLGISTIPLREALVQLASEGLVEMPPNRAKRVKPLAKRSLLELHAVFVVLTMQAFEWGVPHLTPEHLGRLEMILERQKDALARQSWVEGVKLSMEFNAVLYRASENLELSRLLERMNIAFARASLLIRPVRDRRRNHLVYRKVLGLLKAGKWPDAARAYRKMLDELHGLIELLPEAPPHG